MLKDYIKKLCLILSAICIVVFTISEIFNYVLSNLFFYSGLLCFLTAGGAVIGNNDTKNFHAESISERTFLETSKDTYNQRSNFSILIFMSLIGIILLIISSLTGCTLNNASFKEASNSKNTLIWNLSGILVDSWDPHVSDSSIVADIDRQIFEGLTVLDENGYKLGTAESFTTGPNLEGIDNTVYTFKLRQDAKWSDGKRVTAYDFEYGFKRACEMKAEASKIYSLYIKGADEYINGTGSLDDIKVKALDKNILEVEIKEPTPYFMEILSNHQFYPVRKDVVEAAGEGWETNPESCISNGPYMLHSYEPDSYILLSKNPSYFENENVNIPYIKCLINTQNKNMNLMYDNNEVHLMRIYPYGDLEGDNLLYSNYIGTSYILFNTSKKPFEDVNVRKAFAYGIDSKYYSETVYPDSIQSYGFIPPNMKLSNGETIGINRENADYLMDVNSEKAMQLLNTAGYNNDFPEVELTTDNEFFGNHIKSMLNNNLNVNVKLNIVSFQELIKKRNTGDFEMITESWSADYNDTMTFLSVFNMYDANVWYKENFVQSIENSAITTGTTRDKLLINAEKVLIDELPAIPIYHYRYCYRFNNNIIENLKCDVMGNLIIKDCILESKNIEHGELVIKESYELESIYGFDNRDRIEEIDKKGYFEDSAGYKFDKYVTSEHFELYYSSDNESNKFYASNSLIILEEEYDRVLEFLNVDEKNMPVVKINMYDEYEPLRQSLIKETNFDPNIMNGISGTYVNSNNFYFTLRYNGNQVDIKTTLIHEFTHNVTMALVSNKPRVDWLWDGTAMYVAQDKDKSEPYYEEMLDYGIPAIYSLKDNYRDRYIYGYSMVEYIVEEYGRDKLVELLTKNGDIEKVLDVTENAFREAYMQFLKEKTEN